MITVIIPAENFLGVYSPERILMGGNFLGRSFPGESFPDIQMNVIKKSLSKIL